MTALDVLRVVAWPLVVLVVALGVFKRMDIWRDINARLRVNEALCAQLGSSLSELHAELGQVRNGCTQDRGVNAHTAEAVAAAGILVEKLSAQVKSLEMRISGDPRYAVRK